jgi:hypothetical protein
MSITAFHTPLDLFLHVYIFGLKGADLSDILVIAGHLVQPWALAKLAPPSYSFLPVQF